MTKTVDVLLPLSIDQLFSYAVEEGTKISIGDYVVVPFGRNGMIRIVWRKSSESDRELKHIEEKVNLSSIKPKLIEFAEWVAQYNVILIGMLAKVIMGGVLKVNQVYKLVCIKQQQEISVIDYQLNPEQQAARDKIISNWNEYLVSFIDGETGSGKTEVYLSVIARLIEPVNDAQVLILLPEIFLTSQLVNRVHSQTSGNIVEWHSGLTPKARRNNWLTIANGSAQIIIGARSALFLPYKNLKLIIVGEEHDSSFKQEQGIIYNVRDMAIILAKLENIPNILSSATPQLETIYHVKKEGITTM